MTNSKVVSINKHLLNLSIKLLSDEKVMRWIKDGGHKEIIVWLNKHLYTEEYFISELSRFNSIVQLIVEFVAL